MKRFLILVLIGLIFTVGSLGCGPSGKEGINSGYDRPKPAKKVD